MISNDTVQDKIVLVTGGFDPLHSGHIEYFKAARALGSRLVVGVNSDQWLVRKKGQPFMRQEERILIIDALECVDEVLVYDDDDDSSIDAIRKTLKRYPSQDIVFANGGDRTKNNIPEMAVVDPRVIFEFGVGGTEKMNSSSWILMDWKMPKVERDWGYYRTIHEPNRQVKVKELTVMPGQRLSMQRHQDRAEHWFVAEGTATVYSLNRSTDQELLGEFHEHQALHISRTQWHQLCNEGEVPLRVVEIQYGERCEEEDIERKQKGQ